MGCVVTSRFDICASELSMVVAGVIATLCQVAAGVNTAARDVANAQRMQRGMRCCVCVCGCAHACVCGCTGAYVLARMCRCASSANCTKNQKPRVK